MQTDDEQLHAAVRTMLDAFGIYEALRDERGGIVDFVLRYVNGSRRGRRLVPRLAARTDRRVDREDG